MLRGQIQLECQGMCEHWDMTVQLLWGISNLLTDRKRHKQNPDAAGGVFFPPGERAIQLCGNSTLKLSSQKEGTNQIENQNCKNQVMLLPLRPQCCSRPTEVQPSTAGFSPPSLRKDVDTHGIKAAPTPHAVTEVKQAHNRVLPYFPRARPTCT